jgi:exonuclease III
MPTDEADERLNLITWSLNRASVSHFKDQLTALQDQSPEIVALQEVGVKARTRARELQGTNWSILVAVASIRRL